jgi:hypothetical protein
MSEGLSVPQCGAGAAPAPAYQELTSYSKIAVRSSSLETKELAVGFPATVAAR